MNELVGKLDGMLASLYTLIKFERKAPQDNVFDFFVKQTPEIGLFGGRPILDLYVATGIAMLVCVICIYVMYVKEKKYDRINKKIYFTRKSDMYDTDIMSRVVNFGGMLPTEKILNKFWLICFIWNAVLSFLAGFAVMFRFVIVKTNIVTFVRSERTDGVSDKFMTLNEAFVGGMGSLVIASALFILLMLVVRYTGSRIGIPKDICRTPNWLPLP